MKLKNNKASGVGQLPAGILKAETSLTANILFPLYQEIWENEKNPDE
jgi:hypothetical protein